LPRYWPVRDSLFALLAGDLRRTPPTRLTREAASGLSLSARPRSRSLCSSYKGYITRFI